MRPSQWTLVAIILTFVISCIGIALHPSAPANDLGVARASAVARALVSTIDDKVTFDSVTLDPDSRAICFSYHVGNAETFSRHAAVSADGEHFFIQGMADFFPVWKRDCAGRLGREVVSQLQSAETPVLKSLNRLPTARSAP